MITAWAGARIALGAGALLVPRTAAGFWVGRAAATPGGAVLGRALGGRDLALGALALHAARTHATLRPVVLACGASDAADALATAVVRRSLPPRRRGLVIAASAGSALLAVVLAQRTR